VENETSEQLTLEAMKHAACDQHLAMTSWLNI